MGSFGWLGFDDSHLMYVESEHIFIDLNCIRSVDLCDKLFYLKLKSADTHHVHVNDARSKRKDGMNQFIYILFMHIRHRHF